MQSLAFSSGLWLSKNTSHAADYTLGCCSKPQPKKRFSSLAMWDYAYYLFCQCKTHA